MSFQGCIRAAGDWPEATRAAFDRGLAALSDGIAEARRLISGLRPPGLDEAGVVAAIKDLVMSSQPPAGPAAIRLRVDVHFGRLEPLLETAIFRIVQESLTNALATAAAGAWKSTCSNAASGCGSGCRTGAAASIPPRSSPTASDFKGSASGPSCWAGTPGSRVPPAKAPRSSPKFRSKRWQQGGKGSRSGGNRSQGNVVMYACLPRSPVRGCVAPAPPSTRNQARRKDRPMNAPSNARQSLPSRRRFLRQTAGALAGTALAGALGPRVYAGEDNTIKIALVGCGGRGSGAAANALSTRGPTQPGAMADVFDYRLAGSHKELSGKAADKLDVPDDRQFVGMDAYQKAIDVVAPGGLVLLATPPAFRPLHLEYAVAKDCHVFMEKSFAVDAPGVHRVLAAGRGGGRRTSRSPAA